MSYIGDFRLGDTFDTKFTTRQISGAPSTLSDSPVISAYVGNSTTEITAGITLSVDFDSRTGLNNVRVVATSGNGYATASNYQLVITTGTVNSVSVVGEVIAEFSIENRSALMPTTAARTLAVDASGRALSDVDTIKTNAVVNGGTITFPTTATLASTTNISAGTITTATNVTTVNGLAAAVITASSIAADAITAAKIADGAIDAATFAAGAIDASAIAANAIGASELAADAANEIADAVLDRNMATGTDSGSSTVRTVRQALRALRNKFTISGTTRTVMKEDDATTSWTSTISTDASADPIVGDDPAGP